MGWDAGSFRGWRVRGGAAVDLDWKDGRATKAAITALAPGRFIVKMPAGVSLAKVSKNGAELDFKDDSFALDLRAGESLKVTFF